MSIEHDAWLQATNVVLQFFHGLDVRDDELVASLFAPDGVWVRQGVPLTGPDAVRAAMAQRPASRVTCHLVTNLRVEQLDAGHARMRFYLTAYESLVTDGPDVPPRMASIRDCTDDLVRIDGAWRIQSKTSRRQVPPE